MVVALLLGLMSLPAWSAGSEAEGGATVPATIPEAGRVATVERSSAGPALMAFTHGVSDQYRSTEVPLVLGAHEDVLRRVGAAEDRSSEVDLGAPAPMLLSPDGTTVAVGATRDDGSVELVDLGSGDSSTVQLADVNAAVPVAFSADGSVLWVRARGVATSSSGTSTLDDWTWRRVDVETGTSTRVPEFDRSLGVATSQDGEHLLLVQNPSRAQLLNQGDLSPAGEPFEYSGRIPGTGVSPDGSRVGAISDADLTLYPLDGSGAAPVDVDVPENAELLGWVDDDTVLLGVAGTGQWELVRLGVEDGAGEILAVQPVGDEGETIREVSVASGLLADLAVREPGDVDRGGPGALLWVGLMAACAAVAVGALLLHRRLQRR